MPQTHSLLLNNALCMKIRKKACFSDEIKSTDNNVSLHYSDKLISLHKERTSTRIKLFRLTQFSED